MADQQTTTETTDKPSRYLDAANRHNPRDPRSAASLAAPDQPGAGVVSPVAVERGQNQAGGVSELDYEPEGDQGGDAVDAFGVPLPAASSKSDPGNADADTGHKADALGTVKERTAREDLPAPSGVSVEGGEAKATDTSSSKASSSKSK